MSLHSHSHPPMPYQQSPHAHAEGVGGGWSGGNANAETYGYGASSSYGYYTGAFAGGSTTGSAQSADRLEQPGYPLPQSPLPSPYEYRGTQAHFGVTSASGSTTATHRLGYHDVFRAPPTTNLSHPYPYPHSHQSQFQHHHGHFPPTVAHAPSRLVSTRIPSIWQWPGVDGPAPRPIASGSSFDLGHVDPSEAFMRGRGELRYSSASAPTASRLVVQPSRARHGYGHPSPADIRAAVGESTTPSSFSSVGAIASLRYAGAAYKSTGAEAFDLGLELGFGPGPPGIVSPRPQAPANMAILLHDPRALHPQPLPHHHPAQYPTPHDDEPQRPPAIEYAGMYYDYADDIGIDVDDDPDASRERDAREKRHGCTMCHKRFDRPSTLKKHLLVHTGEKAFQCSICERRFGVMSNLNRHVRRCSLRQVHLHGSKAKSAAIALAKAEAGENLKRRRSTPTEPKTRARPTKRRRRPPSPSRWVPPSLRAFNLLPPEASPPASLPLEPVSPSRSSSGTSPSSSSSCHSPGSTLASEYHQQLPEYPAWDEERDSYDENVGSAPYRDFRVGQEETLAGACAGSGGSGRGSRREEGEGEVCWWWEW
ncbi:hypothetical protein C8F01DRAFT_1255101 [Mycena amicta]|nr:hypothetical protein C8F01DRAFT_1255101 [Mycena amicta]